MEENAQKIEKSEMPSILPQETIDRVRAVIRDAITALGFYGVADMVAASTVPTIVRPGRPDGDAETQRRRRLNLLNGLLDAGRSRSAGTALVALAIVVGVGMKPGTSAAMAAAAKLWRKEDADEKTVGDRLHALTLDLQRQRLTDVVPIADDEREPLLFASRVHEIGMRDAEVFRAKPRAIRAARRTMLGLDDVPEADSLIRFEETVSRFDRSERPRFRIMRSAVAALIDDPRVGPLKNRAASIALRGSEIMIGLLRIDAAITLAAFRPVAEALPLPEHTRC